MSEDHALEMSMKIDHIESTENVDGISYSVIILGDCAMSGDGEGIPDDVAAVRLTLRKIKYRENIDLARLAPDATVKVTILPTQAQLEDFDAVPSDPEVGE